MASKNNEAILAVSISLTCAGLIILVIIIVIFLILQKRWKICGKRFRDSQIDLMRHQSIYEITDWSAASPKIHSFVPMPPSTKNATAPTPATVSLSSSETASQGSIPSGSVDMLFVDQQRENLYSCKNCGKMFTRKSLLIKHKLTFKQRKIYCDCGRTFRQNTLFQAHLPSCKRKRDIIQADNTARYEPKESQLSHVNTDRHENETLALAGNDIRNLQKPSNMKENAEDDIHTKSTPTASSEYTGKETELSSIANVEVEEPVATAKESDSNINRGSFSLSETVATGAKPEDVEMSPMNKKKGNCYSCNTCGKFFTRKSLLLRHKLTFKQQKIYCDCGRTFRHNTHFQAHLPSCKRKRDVIQVENKEGDGMKDSQSADINLERRGEEAPAVTRNEKSHQREVSDIKYNETRDIHINKAPIVTGDTEKGSELSVFVNVQKEQSRVTVTEESDLNHNLSMSRPLPLFLEDLV